MASSRLVGEASMSSVDGQSLVEAAAHQDWLVSGDGMHEHVALVIQDGEGALWYRMENVAQPSADGRGEFLVEGPELARACLAAAQELGYVQLGADTRRGVDAMLRERVVVLWHTHTATTEPSREDIAEFPTWLADYGMVYHVPSGTTTVYNNSGIISSTRVSIESALATTKE